MTDYKTRSGAPWWFWLISGVALLWNLMGVAAYIHDVNLSPEQIVETYGDKIGEAMAVQPAFITGAYALAVFGGALGCLLLLLRKKAAIWPLLISFICVVIQQIYGWFITGVMGEFSLANRLMYISIPIIAALLIWFARRMTARGILT